MQISQRTPIANALSGMIGLAAAMGIGRFVLTPILPGMMDGLSLSASDAGLIASANYLGYLVGAIAATATASGRERALVVWALFANAALTAAMGFSESLPFFIAVRFLAGIASAYVLIFLTSMILEKLARQGREGLSGVHFGGVGLGITVSSIVIGAVLLLDGDWRQGWFWCAGLALAVAIVQAFTLEPQERSAGTGREPRLPRDRDLMRLILSYGLFGIGYIVTATFLVAIVRQGEASRLFEPAVWLVTGLAGLFSVWFWNVVASRTGVFRAYALGCVVELVGVVASVGLGGLAGPLLGGFLLGGTFIGVTALGLQAGRRLAPASSRRCLALMTVSFSLGQIAGPLMAGYLADWTGSFTLPSLVAAAALALAALLVVGLRSGSRVEARTIS